MKLHWLPVRLQIEFKILLLTFKILHCLALLFYPLLSVHRDIVLEIQMTVFYLVIVALNLRQRSVIEPLLAQH